MASNPYIGNPIDFSKKGAFISTGDYLSPQGTGDFAQLSRVQDINWTVNYPLQNEVYLDLGNETIMSQRPTVACNMAWYTTNGYNEKGVGLYTNGLSGAFINLNSPKNLYIATAFTPGYDLNGLSNNNNVGAIGVGQVLLSSYSISARAGGTMDTQVTLEGLNSVIYTGVSGQSSPAVDSESGDLLSGIQFTLPLASSQYPIYSNTGEYPAANLAGDIFMEFPMGSPLGTIFGTNERTCQVQSFSMNFSVNRQSMRRMGYTFPDNRAVLYPVDVSVSVEALVNSYQAARLNELGCYTSTGQEVEILVMSPCGGKIPIQFTAVGMRLQSQSSSVSVDSPLETATFNWNLTISNPYSATNNVFIKEVSELEILCAYETGVYIPFITSDGYNLRALQPAAS